MSVLSEWDIVKELGKGIYIYPFKSIKDNLSGACLRLTASQYAYRVESIAGKVAKEPTSLVQETDDKSACSFLVIPKKQTALIWTNESVVLSGRFCGSIHSKVKLAASNIGHIGTKVNPYWGGVLSIAIHNLSDEDIKIMIGETIAYLRFYKLTSESSEDNSDSLTTAYSKLANAFPSQCPIPDELEKWVIQEAWRDGIKDKITEQIEKDKKDSGEILNVYEKAKQERDIHLCLCYKYYLKLLSCLNNWVSRNPAISLLISALIGAAATILASPLKDTLFIQLTNGISWLWSLFF